MTRAWNNDVFIHRRVLDGPCLVPDCSRRRISFGVDNLLRIANDREIWAVSNDNQLPTVLCFAATRRTQLRRVLLTAKRSKGIEQS
jgi:hypothetical protein